MRRKQIVLGLRNQTYTWDHPDELAQLVIPQAPVLEVTSSSLGRERVSRAVMVQTKTGSRPRGIRAQGLNPLVKQKKKRKKNIYVGP